MRCLYCIVCIVTCCTCYKLQAHTCVCVYIRTCVCLCGCEWVDVFVECRCSMHVDLCIHLYRMGLLLCV